MKEQEELDLRETKVVKGAATLAEDAATLEEVRAMSSDRKILRKVEMAKRRRVLGRGEREVGQMSKALDFPTAHVPTKISSRGNHVMVKDKSTSESMWQAKLVKGDYDTAIRDQTFMESLTHRLAPVSRSTRGDNRAISFLNNATNPHVVDSEKPGCLK